MILYLKLVKFMELVLYYWTALIIFVFTPFAFAGPISVSFDDKNYELNLAQDFVAFNEPLVISLSNPKAITGSSIAASRQVKPIGICSVEG
jgi:hypothetical protein